MEPNRRQQREWGIATAIHAPKVDCFQRSDYVYYQPQGHRPVRNLAVIESVNGIAKLYASASVDWKNRYRRYFVLRRDACVSIAC